MRSGSTRVRCSADYGPRGIEHQQRLEDLDQIVVLVRVRSNSTDDILPLVDEVKETLPPAGPRSVVRVPEG